MTKPVPIVVALLVAGGALTVAPRVQAGCHSFTVSAPNAVAEGTKVPVRIQRDGAVNPSSVRVTTVSGTAEAPSDFIGFNERVAFTNETSRTVMIETVEDTAAESTENFAVRLSDGQGCAVNPNFSYGQPERISITDDDAATSAPTAPAPTSVPTSAATAPAGSVTASPSPSVGPTSSPSISPTPSTLPTAFALPVDDEDGFPWLPVAGGAAAVVAIAGGLVLARMRRGRTPGAT